MSSPVTVSSQMFVVSSSLQKLTQNTEWIIWRHNVERHNYPDGTSFQTVKAETKVICRISSTTEINEFSEHFIETADIKSEAFLLKRFHCSLLKQQYVKPSGCWKLPMSQEQQGAGCFSPCVFVFHIKPLSIREPVR